MLAADNGELKVVKLLIEAGARIDGAMANGCTALMLAARRGQLEVVRFLIEKGVNVNGAMVNGWTALILATQNGRLEIARLLIEVGANVNVATADDCTASRRRGSISQSTPSFAGMTESPNSREFKPFSTPSKTGML